VTLTAVTLTAVTLTAVTLTAVTLTAVTLTAVTLASNTMNVVTKLKDFDLFQVFIDQVNKLNKLFGELHVSSSFLLM
jgi:hypothetical protein